LSYRDSDALFSLGLVLSDLGGRDDESIRAYRQSLALNGEDAELCYNLAIKLGSMGLAGEEAELYARAVAVDPRMAGAWLNWGTALAEAGDADGAEAKFERALDAATGSSGPSSPPQPPQAPAPRSGLCARDTRLDDRAVAAKAALNLALLHAQRGERLARSGDLEGARAAASRASALADGAGPASTRSFGTSPAPGGSRAGRRSPRACSRTRRSARRSGSGSTGWRGSCSRRRGTWTGPRPNSGGPPRPSLSTRRRGRCCPASWRSGGRIPRPPRPARGPRACGARSRGSDRRFGGLRGHLRWLAAV
jgi:hypothetical protein